MRRTPENRGHRLEALSVDEPWDTILELVAGTSKEHWVISTSSITGD